MPTVAVACDSATTPPGAVRRVVPEPTASAAEQAWAALVPLMSADRWMLVSLDGGKTYRRRGRRIIGPTPPRQPAAIPIYDGTGHTRLLVIDLDTKKTTTDQVLIDLKAACSLLRSAGGRMIVDRSPSGGHHVYLPLAEPLSLGEAGAFARAIAARLPSADPQPMLNAQTGVIRPPGSLYKGGKGHQQLITPLGIAYDILRCPAPPAVLRELRVELAPELDALARDTEHSSLSDDLADAPWQPLPGGARQLTARYAHIAATGIYDANRYASPSEARQAVLCSAVAAGLQLADVAKRIETGLWAGLNSFYQRYHRAHRRGALARDWREADRYVRKQRSKGSNDSSVRHCDTRGQDTHAGAPPAAPATGYQQVRVWIAAVDQHAPDHLTPDQHMLLRTLAEAGQKIGSTEVEFGVRSLSVAAGKKTHQALAKNLVALREHEDPFIELVEQHQGVVADRYRLRLPHRYADLKLHNRPWRSGKIHGVRAPFRELGSIAALSYEALENAEHPRSARQIAETLRRSPEAVNNALAALAAWDLAERCDRGWQLSPRADLAIVAEALGVLDEVHEQLHRIRAERRQWWDWLGVRRLHTSNTSAAHIGARVQQPSLDEPPPEPPWNEIIPSAPPEDEQLTMLRLLEQILDATPIAAPRRAG